MDESSQIVSARRAERNDGEIMAPRTKIEIVAGVHRLSPLSSSGVESTCFELPLSAIGPLFRDRLERIHSCQVGYELDVSNRATTRVLGGYYKSRRLVRVYARDRQLGRRPLEELFDTFLHEMAHHLEYTEPFSFSARSCGRVPGRMHSRLFWRILGELKYRWAFLQRQRGG
jgi:hypothetical protein